MDKILTKVKNGLGITSEAQYETLKVFIVGVKSFMKDSGVSDDVLDSDDASGAIVSGVIDTWNYGSGEIKLSPFTKARIIQLKYKTDEQTNSSEG